jgi:hypothetical protein
MAAHIELARRILPAGVWDYSACQKFFPYNFPLPLWERVRVRGKEEKSFGNECNFQGRKGAAGWEEIL